MDPRGALRLGRLRDALEALRDAADAPARVLADPVAFPRRFSDPRDAEIAALLACYLAYGRVPLFSAALEKVLAVMGPSPRAFVEGFDTARDLERLRPFVYRMNRGLDVAWLLFLVQRATARHGSLGALFLSLYQESDPDIGPTLERFVEALSSAEPPPEFHASKPPRVLSSFLSRPSRGSACKRLNLFLRWVVRPDHGVDLGLWEGVDPAKLVIPLDTHVLRIARYLGLTRRRAAGWATAEAVTAAFRRVSPSDPLRYDFAVCHHGISGACPVGRAPFKCRACPLLGVCAKGRMLAGPIVV